MTLFNEAVLVAVDKLADATIGAARDVAQQTGESIHASHSAIVQGLKLNLHAARPDVADARTALWRVRIMLQRDEHGEQVAADTSPDKQLGEPGDLLIRGLPAVASELAELAGSYHAGKVIRGLAPDTLAHSLKGFRPSLSRLGGNATWRPRYTIEDPETDAAPGSLRGLRSAEAHAWIAHVHVVRELEAGAKETI